MLDGTGAALRRGIVMNDVANKQQPSDIRMPPVPLEMHGWSQQHTHPAYKHVYDLIWGETGTGAKKYMQEKNLQFVPTARMVYGILKLSLGVGVFCPCDMPSRTTCDTVSKSRPPPGTKPSAEGPTQGVTLAEYSIKCIDFGIWLGIYLGSLYQDCSIWSPATPCE